MARKKKTKEGIPASVLPEIVIPEVPTADSPNDLKTSKTKVRKNKPPISKPQRGPYKKSKMENGLITEEKLFLFVPKDTLTKEDQKRFVQLCDTWIRTLNAETLNDIDIEEIALYYRERIYLDSIYKTFADSSGLTDSTLISQIEKLNKSSEKRKENLAARFTDKGTKRKYEEAGVSNLMDLFAYFDESPGQIRDLGLRKQVEIESSKANFVNSLEYMEAHTSGSIKTDPVEEDN